MASVSSVNSNMANSLYGNRNVLSGLASGMDTESMIKNAVSGIKTKIANLGKQRTTAEWKQEAYRSITDKMVQFTRKYTSYASSTNLFSASFFDKAILTTANGTNSKYVTASGKSSSDVVLNSIDQLASAARYVAKNTGILASVDGTITAKDGINLTKPTDISTISGSLSFAYGKETVSINFSKTEVYKSTDELKEAIVKKLGEQKIVLSDGTQVNASDRIGVTVGADGKTISFSDQTGAGNSVSISGAIGDIKTTLGITGENQTEFKVEDPTALTKLQYLFEELSGKPLTVNYNGTTKKMTLPTVEKNANGTYKINGGTADVSEADLNTEYTKALQASLDTAFGKDKIKVSNQDTTSTSLQLSFGGLGNGNSLTINSAVGDLLGIGKSATSYLSTSKTLKDLLGADMGSLAAIKGAGDSAIEKTDKDGKTYYEDSAGNKVDKDNYLLNADGKRLYSLKVNDVEIGRYSEDTPLETIMVGINSNTEAGVNVNYSKITNQFVFTAKETGASGAIQFGDGLAQKLFGTVNTSSTDYTAGQDAQATMTINGAEIKITRSSNTINVDGMSLTLNGTFSAAKNADGTYKSDETVTFSATSDTEKVIGAIKDLVKDYNEMITEIKKAYSTLPAQKSNGSKYEPLTDDEKADLSETTLKNYEEKAKQGILFGDSDLSSLYSKLNSAFSPAGTDGAALRNMGITTTYSDGLSTITLDEEKLKNALNSNPDAVKDAFIKVSGTGGASTDGIMQTLKKQLDNYASVEGTKGILINKAGSKYSALSLLNNALQKNMENIDTQVEKWETKLSNKVDYYTSKFTQLEKLVAQMNSQSSTLTGLMGG